MMQQAVNNDIQMQSGIDLESMDYQQIMSLGFPFVPVKRVDVRDEGVDIRHEVETIVVESGTPVVLENWHKHSKWRAELFTFPYLADTYGKNVILCRDLYCAQDVSMSMLEYIQTVHAESLNSSVSNSNFPKPMHMDETSIGGDIGLLSDKDTDMETHKSDQTEAVVNGDMSIDSLLSFVSSKTTTLSTKLCATSDVSVATNLAKSVGLNMASATSTNERTSKGTKSLQSKENSLLYAKDVTCPEDWRLFLMADILPQHLGYLRENDLNTLNPEVAAENLMIYIGQAGTWTPCHIDQCGAIGHNIMTWADDDSSAIWFMIRAEDKEKAEELWRSFGYTMEYESYFASVEQLRQATFPIFVVEQKAGDFVMVPSLGYHQVVNLGKATIKVSWNRLTANCLKAAVNVVLPRYREIGRPEGYRIRTIIKGALEAWTDLLKSQSTQLPLPKEQFCQSFKDIVQLFQTIVEDEWVDMFFLAKKHSIDIKFKKPRRLQNPAPAVCDFCNTDIWNRQFHCSKCTHNSDAYDICTRCYSLGRGCIHRATSMEFVEAFSISSCQRLNTEAIKAWNQSQVLAGCSGHDPIIDAWANGINPALDKSCSFTTVAYLRQQRLRQALKICHRCRNRNAKFVNTYCSDCNTPICEKCLYRRDNVLWADVVSKKEPWVCPRCTGNCHCHWCEKKNTTVHSSTAVDLGAVTPNIASMPVEVTRKRFPLMFTQPDDDDRNRGGICDNIIKSFAMEDQEYESNLNIEDNSGARKASRQLQQKIRQDDNESNSKEDANASRKKRSRQRSTKDESNGDRGSRLRSKPTMGERIERRGRPRLKAVSEDEPRGGRRPRPRSKAAAITGSDDELRRPEKRARASSRSRSEVDWKLQHIASAKSYDIIENLSESSRPRIKRKRASSISSNSSATFTGTLSSVSLSSDDDDSDSEIEQPPRSRQKGLVPRQRPEIQKPTHRQQLQRQLESEMSGRIQISQTSFEEMMGIKEERVLRSLYSNGMFQTMQALKAKQ
ncbi:hypothetical protein BCR41DRAFT_326597 [Lobosporangium transversale]|uniref:JmjC domain-containing protein n=1 Tax=Lobosporangium transversale TaxID=64571 RepID=A0A1Y2GE59_9FUNG|nr:hypothetical protein BCR41DRAFT_326597 [Lobosporangium transversale]ORZ07279.1 hypothetical protein BCR41DRAFT_326597 [Lobosporangium transversale]|eukprot:XP_021877942.1 hypothetical protein BCR41DRAFT_326597 [Lobosporangium transversale]